MLFQIKMYFEFDKRNAIWKKEIIGGISTFFAMCYILFVNPSYMVSTPLSGDSGQTLIEMNSQYLGGVFLGTAIVSFLATFLMGLVSKVPLCQAPGMGINTFFVYQVASQFGFGYQQALVIVMIAGILYFLVAITPARQIMMKAFSNNLKVAIGTMTGIFICYIGLASLGVIQQGVWTAPSSVGTYLNNPIVIIGILGIFILIALHYLKVPCPILIFAVIAIIMLAITYACNVTYTDANGNSVNILATTFSLNSYSDLATFSDISALFYQADVWKATFENPLAYVAILTFFFISFMDASGTMYAVGSGIGMQNVDLEAKGIKNWITRANVVEGFSTAISPLFLQSPVVSYIESKTGVVAGAKTGISAMITAVLFLVAIALWPILNPLLPIQIYDASGNTIGDVRPISGPVLVFVGILSISQLKLFKWKQNPADIPMLLFTIMMGVLGFSISNGIAWGLVVYVFVSLIITIKKLIKEDLIDKQKNNSNNSVTVAKPKRMNVIIRFWRLFKSKSQYELNGIVIITSIFALMYIILDALIVANVIAG